MFDTGQLHGSGEGNSRRAEALRHVRGGRRLGYVHTGGEPSKNWDSTTIAQVQTVYATGVLLKARELVYCRRILSAGLPGTRDPPLMQEGISRD
jgi:hypothetical protein